VAVKRLLLVGLLVGGAALVAVQWPDIQRYLKIRSM
jgi:hypothetical protein